VELGVGMEMAAARDDDLDNNPDNDLDDDDDPDDDLDDGGGAPNDLDDDGGAPTTSPTTFSEYTSEDASERRWRSTGGAERASDLASQFWLAKVGQWEELFGQPDGLEREIESLLECVFVQNCQILTWRGR